MSEAGNAPKGPVKDEHIMGVYQRAPLAFERGEGVRLYTAEGEEYLDCMAGIAVNALGHAHPKLVQALKDQGEKLWHVSNIFRIPGQEVLAAKLSEHSFADVTFFTNSGTEAVELAIKAARKYQYSKGRPERIEPVRGTAPSVAGNRVAYVRAGIVEWFVNDARGLEHGFTIAAPAAVASAMTASTSRRDDTL